MERHGPTLSRLRVAGLKNLRWLAMAGAVAIATVAGCGSDDDAVEVPDPSELNAYTRAIVESDSHDEIIFPGGDMVVAVSCVEGGEATATVTAVAIGLGEGIYVGEFEPSTGVDLSLQVSAPGEAVAASQMRLDDAEYVVTFADIEGATFDVSGC